MKQLGCMLLAIALCLGAVSTAISSESTVVRLCYESRPNPPLYYGEGHDIPWDKPGINIELFKLIGKHLGITFKFRRTPWNRGLQLLKDDVADAIFNASFTNERTLFGVFPMRNGAPDPRRSVFRFSYSLYTLRESPIQWDGFAVSNVNGKVGYTLGYSIVDLLKSQKLNPESGRSQSVNLQKLLNGRLAAYAGFDTMVDPILEKNPKYLRRIRKIHPPLNTKPYYLLFSKHFYERNPNLAERIWDAIPEVQMSSEYAEMARHYR